MIFAISITANRETRCGHENRSCASYVRAANEHEAYGSAISRAHEAFLVSDGWYAHQASVVQVSQQLIIEEARALVRRAREEVS